MAQFVGGLHFTADSEGFTTWVPPDFTCIRFVPSVTPRFHPQASRVLPSAAGLWQTCATLDPVVESVSMTAPCVPEAPLTPSSGGYVVPDIPSTATTFALGSQSLESASRPVLQFSVPTHGSPEARYRHLMDLAHTLQGIALSVRPSCIPVAPEVPLQPAVAHTAPPSRPSPQLHTAPVMGARHLSPASAQHFAL